NARLLKVQIFALSAALSAVAGSLYAHTMTFVAPASFGFNFSVELVTMVIIGGLASIYGSLLGAALLTVLPELLRAFQDYDIIVYGLLLILMTMFLPGGLAKGFPQAASYWRTKFRRGPSSDAWSQGTYPTIRRSHRPGDCLIHCPQRGDYRRHRPHRRRENYALHYH